MAAIRKLLLALGVSCGLAAPAAAQEVCGSGVRVPEAEARLLVPFAEGLALTDVIPDLWTSLLTERKGMLSGVLPGRSAEHAKELTQAYFAERRDRSRLVRADLAQGWTRYVQGQPGDVRREAEQAIGAWMVGGSVPPIVASA